MKRTILLLGLVALTGFTASATSAGTVNARGAITSTVEPLWAAQTVTYTCTAATGEIQYKDEHGNWQTLLRVTKGHVFVTDTDQEGNFRFLPENGWTRKVG